MESIRVVAERRALADAVIRGDERGKMYGLFLQSFRRERGTSRDTGRGGSRRTTTVRLTLSGFDVTFLEIIA